MVSRINKIEKNKKIEWNEIIEMDRANKWLKERKIAVITNKTVLILLFCKFLHTPVIIICW